MIPSRNVEPTQAENGMKIERIRAYRECQRRTPIDQNNQPRKCDSERELN